MNGKKLVIVGSGETAMIAFEYFTYDSDFEVSGFSVEKAYLRDTVLNNLPVVPLEEIEMVFPPDEFHAFVAISSTQLNRPRTRLFHMTKSMGYHMASYISSKAFVWRNAEIGENCFVFEHNTIQPFVKIGNNVTLWSGNHIGHNSVIGDNCFISSHVVVSGFCEISDNCFLGVNSTVINNTKVARDCFIDAGTVILKDTEEGRIYRGNPAETARVGSLRFFKIRNQDDN